MEFSNNDPICKAARDTDVKNIQLEYVGEGEGGMIQENSTETGILPYVKQMSAGSMHEAEHSKPVSPSALGQPRGMGWDGRWERGSGWGTHEHLWLIHVSVWHKPP